MEIEWVQRVPLNPEHVETIGLKAKELGIVLTVHAPYYVNLNAKDPKILIASKKRVLDALMMAEICGAQSVCVHAAFNLGMPPEKVFANLRRATAEILRQKAKLFPHVNLAFETMGKQTQFGTLEEALAISKEFDLYPCVDIAHMHARENGAWNTEKEFETMLDQYQKALGKASLKNVHFHISGIAYGEKGERKHLPLEESDINWKVFLKVLKRRKVGGVIVCESPIGEEDTLRLQRKYSREKGKGKRQKAKEQEKRQKISL
jgi:deoxyribonuclease-4